MSGPLGGILDDPARLARADPGGMLAAVGGIPGQVRDAWALTRGLELPDPFRAATAVAVLGVGASAIGGDLVRAVWSDRLRVPLEVVRAYDLPAWVGPTSLVVACSASGGGDETLSAVEAAFVRRCPVAVVATGGPLAAVAARAGLPLLTHPAGGPARAAVGHAWMLLAGLLERAGLLALDTSEVDAAAAAAAAALEAWGSGVPTDANLAKQLAWQLLDRMPAVRASGPLTAVARRWKTQLNENAKTLAAWEELPEATHNTVAGHPQPDALRDHQLVITLAAPSDHPRDARRAELADELLGEHGIVARTVRIEGPSRFAQALVGVVLGDLVSTYLGVLYGVDPTPVEAVARIEAAMAGADEEAGEHEPPPGAAHR